MAADPEEESARVRKELSSLIDKFGEHIQQYAKKGMTPTKPTSLLGGEGEKPDEIERFENALVGRDEQYPGMTIARIIDIATKELDKHKDSEGNHERPKRRDQGLHDSYVKLAELKLSDFYNENKNPDALIKAFEETFNPQGMGVKFSGGK